MTRLVHLSSFLRGITVIVSIILSGNRTQTILGIIIGTFPVSITTHEMNITAVKQTVEVVHGPLQQTIDAAYAMLTRALVHLRGNANYPASGAILKFPRIFAAMPVTVLGINSPKYRTRI